VTEQSTDQRQTKASANTDARMGVAQGMQRDAFQAGVLHNLAPRPV